MKRILLPLLLLAAMLPATAATPMAKHVIMIGLDAWGSYSMPTADRPVVKTLMNNGAWTFEKRSVLPSVSAINWASMLMGAGPEMHGYTEWGSKTPELPSRVIEKNGIFPTIFQCVRNEYPEAEIGVIAEWDGIKHLVDSLSVSHLDGDYDYEHDPESSEKVCAAAERYIKEKKPDFCFVYFAEPDVTGHAIGHDTPEYYDVLAQLDDYIARIVKAVVAAGMLDETIFIITSDHGGIGKGHGGKTMEEMRTPFIITGKDIRQNKEIEECVAQYDVAATLAYIFGIKPPQVWSGRPIMSAFEDYTVPVEPAPEPQKDDKKKKK